MLDDQAKVAYRRRLSELREELEEAKELGNVERAEQAEQEIDALTSELSRAVGLGGRNRRAASASERARQSITKTIKAVLERIAQSDAALGRYPVAMHQDRHLLLVSARSRFPDCLGIRRNNCRCESNSPAPAVTRSGACRSSAALGAGAGSLAVLARANEPRLWDGKPSARMIRAAIDRALDGHGSLIMLGGGPGVGKSRLAMEMARVRVARWLSMPRSGTATKETSRFPIYLLSRLSKAVWRRRRASRNSVGGWAKTRLNWPRWRRAFGEFFRTFRNHWSCRPRRSAAIFSRASPRRLRRARSNPFAVTHTRRPALGRRIHARAFDSSRQSRRPAPGCDYRYLSRRIFGAQFGVGQNPGRADSDGHSSAEAGRSIKGRRRARCCIL